MSGHGLLQPARPGHGHSSMALSGDNCSFLLQASEMGDRRGLRAADCPALCPGDCAAGGLLTTKRDSTDIHLAESLISYYGCPCVHKQK